MFWKVLSLGGLALACTPFEPGTDELPDPSATDTETETTAGTLMGGAGRDWSCVGPISPEQAITRPTDNAVRLVQSLRVLSLASGMVPNGVSVRACAQRDVNCTNPLMAGIPLDAQGWADLPLYVGFDGYLEITGPEIVPTLLFYQDALSANSRRGETPLGVVETQLLPMLTAAIGATPDPALGIITLRAFDCTFAPALGVRYSIDKTGVPFYFVAGLPSVTQMETEGSGLGGFLNVPTGIAVVNVELSSGAQAISMPKTVLVRSRWMTALRISAGETALAN